MSTLIITGITSEDARRVIDIMRVARIACGFAQIEREPTAAVAPAFDPTPFLSPCSMGYDTILGYLAKVNPEALALIEDPCEDTQRDGFKLCHMARRADLPVRKVAAPSVLVERGIAEVNSYPLRLLRERFGD